MMKLKKIVALAIAITIPLLLKCQNKNEPIKTDINSEVLVFINSNTVEVKKGKEKLIPYLNHFGIIFETIDLAKERISCRRDKPALIIISHSAITTSAKEKNLIVHLENYLDACLSSGTGILSFDPLMPGDYLISSHTMGENDHQVGELYFSSDKHYITEYHQGNKELFGLMSLPKLSVKKGHVLITGNNFPLLVVGEEKKGKIVQWTSQDWMYYSVLGPMGGLDDCLWKSIVWAARKPFIMRALPPLVTMRVDDVVGAGRQQWNTTPFQWIKTVNKYGFKPWLGLFIYNITPEGLEELKKLVDNGLATASPHAFGRPPRPESYVENIEAYYKSQLPAKYFVPNYYYPNSLPYYSDYYDEFIFFDHNNQKPWSDEVANKILAAVDEWYREIGPLQMSKYLIPHWEEMSSNMVAHCHDEWHIEFTDIPAVDLSWGDQVLLYRLKEGQQPVRRKPFLLYDEPIVGEKREKGEITRSSYNYDFIDIKGKKFFDFQSIISDITGYEWMPDNDVDATAERGIKILQRGLEAKALAVLFTHETDYIYNVKPENWDQIFHRIKMGIAKYTPISLTTDEALRILRAFQTSKIQSCSYDRKSGNLIVKIAGETDVPTSIYLYTEKDGMITEKLLEIPAFHQDLTQVFQVVE